MSRKPDEDRAYVTVPGGEMYTLPPSTKGVSVRQLLALAGISIAIVLGGEQISNHLATKRQREIDSRVNDARRLTLEQDGIDSIMKCQQDTLRMILQRVERNIADGRNSFVSGAAGGYRGGGGCRTKIEIITYPDLDSKPFPVPR